MNEASSDDVAGKMFEAACKSMLKTPMRYMRWLNTVYQTAEETVPVDELCPTGA